jgi:hypothetical protein
MKNLLYKELKLAIHPMVWFFSLFGLMIFIPNYPNCVFVIYTMVAFIFLFQGARENKDIFYSVLLPIKKRDIVKARFYSIASFELLSIAVAAIAGVCTYFMGYGPMGKQIGSMTDGGGIGIPPTFAFFGFVFLSFAIFNSIFLNIHYSKGFKMLVPMIVASFFGVLPVLAAEVMASMSNTPLENISYQLDVISADTLLCQLIVLFSGIAIYVGSFLLTYFNSAKKFEKTDL